jgi:hypothetical protein
MVSSEEIAASQKMRMGALGQDPEAIRRARAAEAAAAAGYTPEERAEKERRITELEALRPGAQDLRDRRLIQGLLGAGGQRGIGGVLGGYGRASLAEEERQGEAQRASVLERQKMLDQLLEAGRAARMKGFDVGTAAEKDVFGRQEKAAGDITQLQVAQQRALDSVLDRQSRERLAREVNAIRREANRLQAESVGETRSARAETRSARAEANQQRLTLNVADFERRLLEEVTKTPEPLDIMAIKTKMADKKRLSEGEQAAYNKFENDRKLALAGARNQANDLRRELRLPVRATPSAPDDKLEGYSLTKVR